MLDCQAPDVEVIADRGDDVVLYQFSLAWIGSNQLVFSNIPDHLHGGIEKRIDLPQSFHKLQIPDPCTGKQKQSGTFHFPMHSATLPPLALSYRRPPAPTVV